MEAIRQALRLLRSHKLRSLLTLFGLVWGTAAVVILGGWGEGMQRMLEHGFFAAGKNLGQAWAGRIGENFTPAVDRRILWLTWDDVLILRRRARLPELVSAETRRYLPVAYRQASLNVEMRGVDRVSQEIRGVRLAAGRQIDSTDVQHRRRVAVLGARLRERLLGVRGRLGDSIRLDGKPFRVVGFLAPVGEQFSRDGELIDDQAWIPITTALSHWKAEWLATDEPVVSHILWRLRHRHDVAAVEREVRGILAERLKVSADDEQAIITWSPVEVMAKIPLDAQDALLLLIALTTLAIGGIGTLSMMLDSVEERRSEIGLRRAVGARQRDIVVQFLLETLAISAVGGLTGIALGVGFCAFLGTLNTPDLVPVPVLQWPMAALAFSVMLLISVLAGIAPAWRAARIEPAETLRSE